MFTISKTYPIHLKLSCLIFAIALSPAVMAGGCNVPSQYCATSCEKGMPFCLENQTTGTLYLGSFQVSGSSAPQFPANITLSPGEVFNFGIDAWGSANVGLTAYTINQKGHLSNGVVSLGWQVVLDGHGWCENLSNGTWAATGLSVSTQFFGKSCSIYGSPGVYGSNGGQTITKISGTLPESY